MTLGRCGFALLAWASVAACPPAGPAVSSGRAQSEFLDTLPRVDVSAEPRVTLGLDESAPAQLITHVAWAALSGDSLLVVGDVGASRIGAFSLDGALRRWIGRIGDGPGEFRIPRDGGLTDDGDIWVFDPSEMRVLVYQPNGEPIATVSIAGDPGETSVVGVDGQGGVWVKTVRHFWDSGAPGQIFQPGERYRTSVTVSRLVDGSNEPVWEGEGDEYVVESKGGTLGGASYHLSPRLLTALVDGALILTRTDSSSIERAWVGGGLTPWIDYPATRYPVGNRYPELRGAHRYSEFPEAQAFVSGSPGSTWLVLRNPNGVFHPHVRLDSSGVVEYLDPGRVLFLPLFVGDRAAVALNHTDLGVEYLTVHDLIREGEAN